MDPDDVNLDDDFDDAISDDGDPDYDFLSGEISTVQQTSSKNKNENILKSQLNGRIVCEMNVWIQCAHMHVPVSGV